MIGSELRGYYHVCTDGNAIPWIFKDDEDFRGGLNRIGLCVIVTGVLVFAYTLMDNHMHFILYGTMQECKNFIYKYKLLLGKWIRGKYGETDFIKGLPTQIIPIKNQEDLLESIAYIDRNCIMAGFKGLPADYPWGSARHIFRYANDADPVFARVVRDDCVIGCEIKCHAKYRKVSEISSTELREIIRSRIKIPDEWTITSNGMIDPRCYLQWERVERLFISPIRYLYYLSKKLEGKIDLVLSQSNKTFIKDKDLRLIVEHLATEMFYCNDIRTLKVNSRLQIARKLRHEYACTIKQISRMLHMDYETLKGFI